MPAAPATPPPPPPVAAAPTAPATPAPPPESSMAKAPEPMPAPSEPPAPPPAPAAPAASAPPAPPPPPPPAPTTARTTTTPAPPAQTASLPPPGGKLSAGQQFRLSFATGAVTLNESAEGNLDAIAKALGSDDALRLQLLAYAGGSQTASQARRLSLSRALAVRSYLIKKGIVSTRIDVRALGNKFEGGPPDRVDVIVTTR